MKHALISRQHYDLYMKYRRQNGESSNLLGECGVKLSLRCSIERLRAAIGDLFKINSTVIRGALTISGVGCRVLFGRSA